MDNRLYLEADNTLNMDFDLGNAFSGSGDIYDIPGVSNGLFKAAADVYAPAGLMDISQHTYHVECVAGVEKREK